MSGAANVGQSSRTRLLAERIFLFLLRKIPKMWINKQSYNTNSAEKSENPKTLKKILMRYKLWTKSHKTAAISLVNKHWTTKAEQMNERTHVERTVTRIRVPLATMFTSASTAGRHAKKLSVRANAASLWKRINTYDYRLDLLFTLWREEGIARPQQPTATHRKAIDRFRDRAILR